jgi:CHAT domain-containing protein/tetratricopeptide (TPR) repeat protein
MAWILCCVCTAECTGASARVRLIETREQAIRILLEGGRYAEAQSSAEELLRVVQSALGNGPSRVAADVLDLVVEARWRNGVASPETLAKAEQLVTWRRDLSNERDLARGLENRGRALVVAGNPDEAVSALESAITTLERAVGRDDPLIADALDSLVLGLVELARYDEADRRARRALEIRQVAADSGPAMARTLDRLGLVAIRAGRYDQARPTLERALTLRNAQANHPEKATTFWLLGDLLWLEGRPTAARDAYQKCVKITTSSLRADHPDVALCTRKLGTMLTRMGDLNGALPLLEQAKRVAEVSLGVDHPSFAGYLNDLAELHYTLMDYQKARSLYEQALAIRERRLGPDHHNLATIVFNLGTVIGDLGDPLEAKRYFDRAIAIWSRRLGADHPFVALATASLARTLVQHGRASEALPLQRRVLAMRERSLGPNHRDTADALGELANTLLAMGLTKEAATASERAIAIWEQADTSDPLAFAAALRLRADVQAVSGDLSGSRERYAQALTITEQILGPDHPNAAELRVRIAAVALQSAQPDIALKEALAAEQAGRRFLESTIRYLPEREALRYRSKRPTGLNLVLSLTSGRLRARVESTRAALDDVIKSRALVLDAIAARQADASQVRGGELASLRAAWVSARQQLANLVVRRNPDLSPQAYEGLLDTTRREAVRAERALAEKSASFKTGRDAPEIGLSDVEAVLPRASALVSFVRYDRAIDVASTIVGPNRAAASYAAFVLRAGASAPAIVPLGSADRIESAVTAWRNQAAAEASSQPGADAEHRLRALGDRLARTIWTPVEPHVRGATSIFVVPDGALHLVNLAALPVGLAEYVIDRAPLIHYLTTERDIVQFMKRPPPTGRGLFALGGPSFDAEPSSAMRATSGPQLAGSASQRSSCGTFQSMRFAPLQGALDEVRDVVNLWNAGASQRQDPVHLFTGAVASEREFKARAPGNRVLHLATHGFFLGGQCSGGAGTRAAGGLTGSTSSDAARNLENPLLQTGLALAGANRRATVKADEEDGILTAEEVAALNLGGVEWAVLSACDTGLGEVENAEGVFGLQRAFQIAGVRTVIMSLWSVDDQATREWMTALYRARLQRKLDTAQSVRAASLDVLQHRRASHLSTNPLYWAAFVAAGDWR